MARRRKKVSSLICREVELRLLEGELHQKLPSLTSNHAYHKSTSLAGWLEVPLYALITSEVECRRHDNCRYCSRRESMITGFHIEAMSDNDSSSASDIGCLPTVCLHLNKAALIEANRLAPLLSSRFNHLYSPISCRVLKTRCHWWTRPRPSHLLLRVIQAALNPLSFHFCINKVQLDQRGGQDNSYCSKQIPSR